ncbi:Hypothetical protein PHPALM_7703 [Phytophthora palmivora]|uniref:Transmembrane protein n=1 Tax=Phytophthora palmivora TaxID=4796 RepID=A0A2P4YBN5_9STRA|nr:Hypothetical protein PHPALM_7703 [Phytophthora palmivora]
MRTLKENNTPNLQNELLQPTITKQPDSQKSHICFFRYSLSPLYDFWERLQVSHCGQYSVERMLALDEYCQRVSITRILGVCFLFPLGPLLVVSFTEFLPLQPAENGAFANYVFWIRHTLIGIILIVCAMAQAKVWIPEMKLTMTQIVVVASGSAIVYTTLNILIADLWVFPIPFLIVAGAPLLFSIWAIASRIALGAHPLNGIQDGKLRGRRFLLLTSVHAALLGIYPVYQALFLAVDGALQLLVTALMPVLNLALKNLQTAWGSHLQDSLPEVIVFTCDVFGTIYSVLCMHSANSMKMVMVIVALNVFVLVLTLYGMNRRSRIARMSRSYHVGKPSLTLKNIDDSRPFDSLVKSTVNLLQVPGLLDATELREIRLLSGMQHKLSEENTTLMASLGPRSVYDSERRTSKRVTMSQIKSQYATVAIEGRKLSFSHFVVPPPPRSKIFRRLQAAVIVVPMVQSRFKRKHRGRLVSLQSFHHDSDESNTDTFRRLSLKPLKSLNLPSSVTPTVQQTLQLLFNNEYLGLIAYTQCFVPVIYLMYMPFLQSMPNHVYYPTHYRYFGNAHEFNQRMSVIAALAALQFAVLITLQVFVTKRFGVSTIYQVAFVLENQFLFLQGRLLIWLIFAVQSTLVHYGADFTFKFAWVTSS